MASLKYLDPITGEYKKVASGGGGTSIPASDTEPASGNYWLDTSADEMPVLKYRPSVGAPWQVVGVTQQTIGLLPQIIVTAPAGSVVTCSKGNTVLNAEEVEGTWTFNVSEYGEWIVNASLDDLETIKTINITSVNQNFVDIEYYNYLYKTGNEYTSITGGWDKLNATSNSSSFTNKNSGMTLTKSTDSIKAVIDVSAMWIICFGTQNKIDLTNYSKLKMHIKTATYTGDGYCYYGVHPELNIDSGKRDALIYTTSSTTITDVTKTLDISELSGQFYIAVSGGSGADADITIEIDKVWLE